MAEEIRGDRSRSLEDAFFAKQDAILRKKLRDLEEARREKEALSTASGITDDAVLARLAALHIDSATFAALSLVPLVMVAWADGSIDDKERKVALSKATEVGLNKEDVSYQLFERWLATRPPPELLATWKDYIRALSSTLDHEATETLKQELLQRVRFVAEASGGFLRIGPGLSASERAVLKDLEGSFASATGLDSRQRTTGTRS